MNPSVELRIRSMMRALTEVVLPAVDPHNSLAQEQARLLLGHLHALALHHRDEARLDEINAAAMATLARELIACSAGGIHTGDATARLREIIPTADPRALSHAVEALMVASGIDGDADFQARSAALVLAHARTDTLRGRAWFKVMNFDATPEQLPSIEQLLRGSDTP